MKTHKTKLNSKLTHPKGEPVTEQEAQKCAERMRRAFLEWIHEEISDEMNKRQNAPPQIENSIYFQIN